MNKIILGLGFALSTTLCHAEGYTNSSISSAQTWYMTLLGPSAASKASTQLDNLKAQQEDDSLAYIATDGKISGPSLERAYMAAKASNPAVTRGEVAEMLATE